METAPLHKKTREPLKRDAMRSAGGRENRRRMKHTMRIFPKEAPAERAFQRFPRVNIIISKKNELYTDPKVPVGEKRLFDKDFWDKITSQVDVNLIELTRPFKHHLPFTQSLETVFYHLKAIKTAKKLVDPNAITHIFFAEEAHLLKHIKTKASIVTCLDIIPLVYKERITPNKKLLPGLFTLTGIKRVWGLFFNKALYSFLIRSLRKADIIQTASAYTKQDIVKHLGIRPEKIRTAYWGINKKFQPKAVPPEFYKKYHLQKEKTYLVSVGALNMERKNLPILLKTFPQIAALDPHIELIIAGYKNTHDTISLADETKNSPLKKRIHLLSDIPDTDLVYLYNAARIFIFPSLYEGFGLPPVEAMACGAPVICSNRTSLPEAVGDAAMLIDPEKEQEIVQAVQKILSNKNLSEEMRKKGMLQAKRFTWEKYAQDILEIYQQT